MTDYEAKFADKNFQYAVLEAEKTDDNEVVVEGTLSRQGSKGKVFFEYTYGCDDEAEDLHFKKKSSNEITDIITESGLEDAIMKKIRTTVVTKGKKLRDPWLEGHDPVSPKTKGDDDTEESEEEEYVEEKTPAKGKRERRTSLASNKSNKSTKSAKSNKPKKAKTDDMTPANKLTSLNLKVKARQRQIEEAKGKRDVAEDQFKVNANKLNRYAQKNLLKKDFAEVLSSIAKIKSLKNAWNDYDYVDSEDEDGMPYEPDEAPEGHCLNDLANVLRSVADIVDSKNQDVELLQKEIDDYTAQWLKARRDHTADQYFEMTGRYPSDIELTNMGV